jgi:hypothetical protein
MMAMKMVALVQVHIFMVVPMMLRVELGILGIAQVVYVFLILWVLEVHVLPIQTVLLVPRKVV